MRNIILIILTLCFIFDDFSQIKKLKTKKNVKLLCVINYFPCPFQRFILNQLIGFRENGFDLSILAFAKDTRYISWKLEEYVLPENVYYQRYPRSLNDFDIIYCQFGDLGNQFAEMKREGKLKSKLVVCFRGGYDINIKPLRNKNMYDNLFEYGDLFLANCNHFKNILIELGCNPQKIIVHSSSTDLSLFTFRKENTVQNKKIKILSVCRFTEKKGVEYSIRAIANLVQKFKNIEFTIIGDGPLKTRLLQLIDDLNIKKFVKMIGGQDERTVLKYLTQSNIFLHPSITAKNGSQDSSANAIKEAMAVGLPIVSTYHGGIPELVEDGVSGFLVPEKDKNNLINALTDKLNFLIQNPDKWRAMGYAGRKKIETEYEMNLLNTRLCELLRMIV